MRVLVNTELMLKLNLKLNELLIKSQQNEKLSDTEVEELTNIQKELKDFTTSRKFRNKSDLQFFQDSIKD